MTRSQSATWELLLILGIVLLLVSPIGDWLGSIVREIATSHAVSLTFNPFDKQPTQIGNSAAGSTGSVQTSTSSSPSLFNVPIVDASGAAGSIQVVANNAASAIENAHQGGNTPTGNAVPA